MKYDYNRNVIAWVILLLTTAALYIAKPTIKINPTAMVLPQTATSFPEIDKKDVNIYSEISPLWSKTLLARISIKYPVGKHTPLKAQEAAFALLKKNAAQIGANAIVIELMGETQWFYTNKQVLQIYAQAYKI